MKFCLSYNQTKEYLQQADEILVPFKYIDDIFDITHDYLDKVFVLDCTVSQIKPEEWQTIEQINRALKDKLKLCLYNDIDIIEATKRNIKCFFATAIRSYDILHSKVALGVSEIRVAGMVAHDLVSLAQNFPNISIRYSPNYANMPVGVPALFGSWVRPEDLDSLPSVEVCEFNITNQRREQALFRIYSKKEQWSGAIELLLEDGDGSTEHLMNRMFLDDFQKRRSECRLECLRSSRCRWCETHAKTAHENFIGTLKENYLDNKE